MKPLCIFHGNCADGFTAAWAVRKALGSEVEFHPGIYGNDPPAVTDRHVVLVDFSYKRPVLDQLFRQAKSLLVLDHHKTAAEDLAGIREPFGPGWPRHLDNVAQDEMENCQQPYALFDMDRSGAQIAWDFFLPHERRPRVVDYVADRDLWRFLMPFSREIAAALFSYPYDFGAWDEFAQTLESDLTQAAQQGAAIERKHHKDVAELVKVTQRTMIIGGHAVPVANLPYTLTSDAGNLMAKGEAFAACYWDTPKGRVFSLRSTNDGIDVSVIAKQYGGGGHRNASGFQMPIGWEGDSQ